MWRIEPDRIVGWMKSAAGLSILLSTAVAVAATLDRGPYILVNTVVTGGMLALVAMGLALVFGVMNIPMFAHGEYFMIGTLVAYYVFTPINAYVGAHPDSLVSTFAPLITIVVAMLASLVVAQTLIPMLASRMPAPPPRAVRSWHCASVTARVEDSGSTSPRSRRRHSPHPTRC